MNDSILILYGTVTGNVEICANKTATHLTAEGFGVVVRDIFDVKVAELQNENTLLVCISTYGEGNRPNTAVPMWETFMHDGQFNLSHLRFSIFSLGDSGYRKFCQCGNDFDAALTRQDAQPLVPLMDGDAEYEKPCAGWIESLVTALKSQKTSSALCATT
jgi:sulfite reductase (NADPH) flavoprotein alpha-component